MGAIGYDPMAGSAGMARPMITVFFACFAPLRENISFFFVFFVRFVVEMFFQHATAIETGAPKV
jgi:hypothetical protein